MSGELYFPVALSPVPRNRKGRVANSAWMLLRKTVPRALAGNWTRFPYYRSRYLVSGSCTPDSSFCTEAFVCCPDDETALVISVHLFPLWPNSPTVATAASFFRFLDHTQRHTTVGRTPLDEGSACCRDLYLTISNTYKRQTSTPGGIQTRNLSDRSAADCLLRHLGDCDRHENVHSGVYLNTALRHLFYTDCYITDSKIDKANQR